jgi:hypothetical protein
MVGGGHGGTSRERSYKYDLEVQVVPLVSFVLRYLRSSDWIGDAASERLLDGAALD